jgi:thermostable 8-oxoguanine DNA glycosylase
MKKIHQLKDNLNELISKAERNYKFQPILTEKLDNITGNFTDKNILEIVLWKTNRYPEFDDTLIDEINELRNTYSTEKAKTLLKKLLKLKGFDLPMASTVLRFVCPNDLQIIDQRVFRFISEETDVFKKPYNDDKKVEVYFQYIEKLKQICHTYNIPFSKSDRILYQLDKELNADHPIKY